MSSTLKNVTINAMGISLFVVLSLCLQVPVFENYYICLGYVAMTVFCYMVGTISGTITGTFGVVLYCLLINGLRGMPGWAAGNLIIGIVLGITFKLTKKINNSLIEFIVCSIIIIVTTAFAMLVVKSTVECFLYSQPFFVRAIKNIYAFIADAFTIIISIPLCKLLEPKLKPILDK